MTYEKLSCGGCGLLIGYAATGANDAIHALDITRANLGQPILLCLVCRTAWQTQPAAEWDDEDVGLLAEATNDIPSPE